MEDFFSLEWFKKTLESSISRTVEEHLGPKIEGFMKDLNEKPVVVVDEHPYKSVKLVNDALTIVFKDGNVVSKPGATEEDFAAVTASKTKEEVLDIIQSKTVANEKAEQVQEATRTDTIIHGFRLLELTGDFTVKDNVVYLKGTSRSLPPLLVEKFARIVGESNDLKLHPANNEEYQSLKNFFMWCCLNPRAEVADQLYNFLMKNSFRITKQGFFVALRNVVTVESGDKTLLKFVSNAYNKVKAVWKAKPANFRVVKDAKGEYSFEKTTTTKVKGEIVGNLETLYKDMPNMAENRYTDAHTRTFDIRVGKPVNMPMAECNWSTADCAHAGLHFTADEIHYVGCGDTSVLVLINPMKVVGIGAHKGRCYEYLPIMTVKRSEATKILHDVSFDTLQLDEDYAIRELDSLADKVKEGFTVEAKKYSFNVPSLSTEEINNIVKSLEGMKAVISKRVSNLG